MKQIIVNQNLVFPAKDVGVEADTSELAALGIVHYEDDGQATWIERDPFEGREAVPGEALPIIEALLAEAQQKLEEQEATPSPEEELQAWRDSVVVSPFQAEQALADFDLLEAVEAWLENEAGDTERRAWRRAQEWRYTSPTINAACDRLGINQEQKDALFRHAQTLEA